MAIIDLLNPLNGDSCQDSLWHIATSDASGLTNMKYVFDVFDNADNHLVRTKIYPDVSTGKGYFDAGSVVRNEVSYEWFDFNAEDYGVYLYTPDQINQHAVTYKIKVGEEYNIGTSGITQLYQSTGTVKAFNYLPPVFGRRPRNGSGIIQNMLTRDDGWLTNRPMYGNSSLDANEPLLIPIWLTDSANIIANLYTDSGTLINSSSVSLGSFTGQNAHEVNLSLSAIYSELGYDMNTYGDGSYALFWPDTNTSQKFRVNFVCKRDYNPICLYFMNAYGMYDTARFDCTNKLTMNATRKSFERKDVNFGNINYGAGSSFEPIYYNSSNVYNETKMSYGSEMTWSYKLQMNFPTDAEWEWLSELIYSPQIYMLIDGAYYPVTVKATNYEYYKQIYTKLKTFELEVEVNQKRNGFRR